MSRALPAGHLFGSAHARRAIAGVVMTETTYEPELRVPRHSHSESGFCFVLDGYVDRTHTFGDREAKPRSISFHPAGELHSERFRRAGAKLFSIQLGEDWLQRLGEGGVPLRDFHSFDGGRPASLASRLHSEFLAPDELSSLMVEGLVLELAAEIQRLTLSGRSAPDWLSRVDDLILDRFRETVGLSEIAAEIEIHPSHLARVYREYRRETVGETVRRMRIGWACEQLRDGESPLAAVALDAGFSSQGHFTTTFRKLMRTTPARYRREIS